MDEQIQLGLFGENFAAAEARTDKTHADRQARMVARRADIGDLPAVVNPDRRERGRLSLVEFGINYCYGYAGALLQHQPSESIENYVKELQNCMDNGGLLHAVLFRGAGKTTWIKIGIVRSVAYGLLRFPVIFAASAQMASNIIQDIWSIFEFSPAFAEDFPEIAFPIAQLAGLAQRTLSQTYKGERTQIKRTANELHLPVIAGSLSSGARIFARGAGSSCRGLTQRGMRPDFVLLDDIQSRKDADSQIRTDKLEAWQREDVFGLGGNKQLSVAKTSTPIKPGDDSDRFSDLTLHPEFRTVKYPFLINNPVHEELWQEYDNIYRDCIKNGDITAADATRFYRIHKEVLDVGANVADEHKYDESLELSAIQHARNLFLRLGEKAFNSEYQLQPAQQQQLLSLKPSQVYSQVNGIPHNTLPAQTQVAVAFIDVMSNDGLHYVVTAFGRHQTAAVIDYGIEVLPKHDGSERAIENALAGTLAKLLSRLYQQPILRVNGTPIKLNAIWVDHGWKTHVVTRVCELFRNRGFANTYSCKGWSSDYYNGGAGKHVTARGNNVDFRERDGVRFAGQNSDYWKETTQRAFAAVPLTPGSLSIYGSTPSVHIDYAAHISSEVLTDRALSQRGAEIYRWTLKPGSKNHFLDATAGTLAMASWYRYWDNDEQSATIVTNAGDSKRYFKVQQMPKRRKIRSA